MPSRCTVQAPHDPRSHTILVPVRSSWSRRSSRRVMPVPHLTAFSAPFSLKATFVSPFEDRRPLLKADPPPPFASSSDVAATPTPAVFRNPRREIPPAPGVDGLSFMGALLRGSRDCFSDFTPTFVAWDEFLARLQSPSSIPGAAVNQSVKKWVDETAVLTKPDRVVWCDGSDQENAS